MDTAIASMPTYKNAKGGTFPLTLWNMAYFVTKMVLCAIVVKICTICMRNIRQQKIVGGMMN